MASAAVMTTRGWPRQDLWVSPPAREIHLQIQELVSTLEANKATMSNSCSRFGLPNNGAIEVNEVDHRFIVAVIMQEPGNYVRIKTSNNDGVYPSLMKCHDGAHKCNRATLFKYPVYSKRFTT